jgi:anti-anti-sigma regulatory factor
MLEHCHAMEIDLTRARCIDLSGVQLMLQMRDEAKEADKLVLFIGWNPAIEEALHVYHWFVDLIGSGRCRSNPVLVGGTA